MNNNYINYNNSYNNKNYFDPNKRAMDNNSLGSVNSNGSKKIKPLYILLILISIVTFLFLVIFLYKSFFSSPSIEESNDIKQVFLVNNYDLSSLIGVTDSGKIITIKEGNEDYTDIYCYKDNLYYIDENNNVYSIDITNNNYSEEKIFSFDLDNVWDLQCMGDYIYVIGDGVIISYNISTSKRKVIDIETDNNIAFSEDGLYIFYYNTSKNGIVKYNVTSLTESLILSSKLIVQGFEDKLFLQDENDDSVASKYFVYDINSDETTEVPIDLNVAYPYDNSIVYAKGISILNYIDSEDVLYTLSDNSKIEGIANIVLLGNRLLIAAEVPASDTEEIGNYEYEYYLFDMNTSNMVKLSDDYGFIIN